MYGSYSSREASITYTATSTLLSHGVSMTEGKGLALGY
jgi:hypothetical protein